MDEDIITLKKNLKNKEKLKCLFEKLSLNLKNLVFVFKGQKKNVRFQAKAEFLNIFPLVKINSIFEELLLRSEAEFYPIGKKIISNLIIFFSYFYKENTDLVYYFLDVNIRVFSLEDLSKEINQEFLTKFIQIIFKRKRFVLFHMAMKYIFGSFKSGATPKVYEFFFDAISKELKNMNKSDISEDKKEEIRKKFLFICDLITRFTHQLVITQFYGSDFRINKFIRIEEIFTKQVKIYYI